MEKVNLNEKFSLFQEYWNPKIVGEVNESHIKLVKLKGEFVWHYHEREDEMFMVVKGELRILIKNEEDIILRENEFFIIPKGIEHKPIAITEVWAMLVEPKTTVNTGNVLKDIRKRDTLEEI